MLSQLGIVMLPGRSAVMPNNWRDNADKARMANKLANLARSREATSWRLRVNSKSKIHLNKFNVLTNKSTRGGGRFQTLLHSVFF